MASLMNPAVVMDCGTGYTKLGFAGNTEPSWVVPSAVGFSAGSITGGAGGQQQHQLATGSMRYCVGEEAAAQGADLDVVCPIKTGTIDNWDCMERLWERCIWQYLRVNPADHNFVLTEPPLNPPEKREATAEIMFETFGVSGLYFGLQAVLALYAGFAAKKGAGQQGVAPNARGGGLTGTVIDSGDGCTHVIPVCDGYVVASAIRSVPVAGRDISSFVQQLMRERGAPLPPGSSLDAARRIKERHCYVCSDMVREYDKHDANPGKYIQRYEGVDPRTGKSFECSVAYERFLGPEVFFNPEIYSTEWRTPLPALVDDVVQRCPIDARRRLYGNVVLSGGSTMFKDFGRRLQRDVKRLVDARLGTGGPAGDLPTALPTTTAAGGGGIIGGGGGGGGGGSSGGGGGAEGLVGDAAFGGGRSAMEVKVVSHPLQRYAAWFGGSIVGCLPDFSAAVTTRAMYEEVGPSVVRGGHVFRD